MLSKEEKRKRANKSSREYRLKHLYERNQITKKWRKNNPYKTFIHNRKHRNKKLYGINEEEMVGLLVKFSYECFGCGLEFKKGIGACIDHNHETNKIRGILCKRCNFAIGYAKDNSKTLKNLSIYLKKYEN